MEIQKPFIPRRAGGQYVSSISAGAVLVNKGQGSDVLCLSAPITNTGIVYAAVGDSSVVATIADYPLLPGSQVSIGKNIDDAYVSLVCPTGLGDVHVIPGIGV